MKVADSALYTVTRESGVIFLISPYFLCDISIGVNPAVALGGSSIVIKWDLGQEGGTGSNFLVSGV